MAIIGGKKIKAVLPKAAKNIERLDDEELKKIWLQVKKNSQLRRSTI